MDTGGGGSRLIDKTGSEVMFTVSRTEEEDLPAIVALFGETSQVVSATAAHFVPQAVLPVVPDAMKTHKSYIGINRMATASVKSLAGASLGAPSSKSTGSNSSLATGGFNNSATDFSTPPEIPPELPEELAPRRALELSLLNFTIRDSADDSIAGWMSLSDQPRPCLGLTGSTQQWSSWLSETFGRSDLNETNTLWIDVVLTAPYAPDAIIKQALAATYGLISNLTNVVIAVPSEAPPPPGVRAVFGARPLVPRVTNASSLTASVYVHDRASIIPRLFIRDGKVEDHDDLKEVVAAQYQELARSHGPFWLASFVGAADKGKDEDGHYSSVLVSESDGTAVGIMAATTDFDIDALGEHYDLDAYDGLLVKPSERAWMDAEDKAPTRPTSGRPKSGKVASNSSSPELGEDEDDEEEDQGDRASDALAPIRNILASISIVADDDDVPTATRTDSPEVTDGSREGGEDGEIEEEDVNGVGEGRATSAARRRAGMFSGGSRRTFNFDLGAGGDEDEEEVPNAVLIELFAMSNELEAEGHAFLKALFDRFPDHDYAVLLLPFAAAELPLLKLFTSVPLKAGSALGKAMYLISRHSLGSFLKVRAATKSDAAPIQRLCASMSDGYAHSSAPSAQEEDFVVEVDNQVVGCFRLFKLEGDALSKATTQFQIDSIADLDYQTGHAELAFGALNPIFDFGLRQVLRDIMRYMGVSVLHARLESPADLNMVMGQFIPMLPRREIQRGVDGDATATDTPVVGGRALLARKDIYDPRTRVASRIVVVGASDTGLCLLRNLVTSPHFHFTGLTLISPGGLPDSSLEHWLPTSGLWVKEELDRVQLHLHVGVVDGSVVEIDRDNKLVVTDVDGGLVAPYDLLVLTTGVQDKTAERLGVPRGVGGVFGVANRADLDDLTGTLASMRQPRVVIAGGGFEAVTIASGLISQAELSGSQIHIVDPNEEAGPKQWGNTTTASIVKQGLEKAGVSTGEVRGRLVNVEGGKAHFSDGQSLDADVIIGASHRSVDARMVTAINASSLVFDGHLMIDGDFCTNDSSILAAGSLTSFARRFRTSVNFEDYNAADVACALTTALMHKVDDAGLGREGKTVNPEELTPGALAAGFQSSKEVYLELPGGLRFWRVGPPGANATKGGRAGGDGRDLKTGSVDNNELMTVHVDGHGLITSMVYIGCRDIPRRNFSALIGVPETAVNSLVSRFDEGLVKDLVSYLRTPWSSALYHDRFPALQQWLTGSLASNSKDLRHISQLVATRMDSGNPLTTKDRAALSSKLSSETRQLVESAVAAFIDAGGDELPEYFRH